MLNYRHKRTMFNECRASRNEARSRLQLAEDDLERAKAVNQNIYALNRQLAQTLEANANRMRTLHDEFQKLSAKCIELEAQLAQLAQRSATSQSSYQQAIENMQIARTASDERHRQEIRQLERERDHAILDQQHEAARNERQRDAIIRHQQDTIALLGRERNETTLRQQHEIDRIERELNAFILDQQHEIASIERELNVVILDQQNEIARLQRERNETMQHQQEENARLERERNETMQRQQEEMARIERESNAVIVQQQSEIARLAGERDRNGELVDQMRRQQQQMLPTLIQVLSTRLYQAARHIVADLVQQVSDGQLPLIQTEDLALGEPQQPPSPQ